MEQTASQTIEYEPGDTVVDTKVEDQDELLVVKILDETISEYEYTWDYNMNPRYVLDDNPSFDADEKTVCAVYLEQVQERFGRVPPLEEVQSLVDENRLKGYHFPRSRLSKSDVRNE